MIPSNLPPGSIPESNTAAGATAVNYRGPLRSPQGERIVTVNSTSGSFVSGSVLPLQHSKVFPSMLQSSPASSPKYA